MVAGWPILVDRLYRYCGSTHTNALKKHCILVQSNNFTRCISYSKHNGWYNSWTAGKAGVLLPERARTDSHWPGDTVWIKTHDWTTIPYHLKANRVIEGENCCFKDCCVRCWEDMTKRTGICCCYRQCKHSELFSTNKQLASKAANFYAGQRGEAFKAPLVRAQQLGPFRNTTPKIWQSV